MQKRGRCATTPTAKRLLMPTRDGVRRLRALCAALHNELSPATAHTLMHVPSAAGEFAAEDEEARAVSAALLQSPHLWVGLPQVPALTAALGAYRGSREAFLKNVLRPAVTAALAFPTLFEVHEANDEEGFRPRRPCDLAQTPCRASRTEKVRVCVNPSYMKLTRRHIMCVVANAFLCCFAEREEGDWSSMPSTTYSEIHLADSASRYGNKVEVAKLLMLFDYFEALGNPVVLLPDGKGDGSCVLEEEVDIWRTVRVRAPRAPTPSLCLPPPVVHPLGESIDDQNDMIRLDFANRWIGGGALSSGCVQEEILFAQSPELNALRWCHGPLDDGEAVVVRGYRTFSSIHPGTYGRIRYGGVVWGAPRIGGAVAVVDAFDFRDFDSSIQYTKGGVRRELKKLVSALLLHHVRDLTSVAGGNWGCGVFGGDYQVKFLIQWLACALSGKILHYFPFDNAQIVKFAPVGQALCRMGFTAADLYEFLMSMMDMIDAGEDADEDVWGLLLEWFQRERLGGARLVV